MTIDMVAQRRHYVKAEGKEYDKGGKFTVDTDKEAVRLEKMGRAKRVVEMPAPERKVMKAETTPVETETAAPRAKRGKYSRRDMQVED